MLEMQESDQTIKSKMQDIFATIELNFINLRFNISEAKEKLKELFVLLQKIGNVQAGRIFNEQLIAIMRDGYRADKPEIIAEKIRVLIQAFIDSYSDPHGAELANQAIASILSEFSDRYVINENLLETLDLVKSSFIAHPTLPPILQRIYDIWKIALPPENVSIFLEPGTAQPFADDKLVTIEKNSHISQSDLEEMKKISAKNTFLDEKMVYQKKRKKAKIPINNDDIVSSSNIKKIKDSFSKSVRKKMVESSPVRHLSDKDAIEEILNNHVYVKYVSNYQAMKAVENFNKLATNDPNRRKELLYRLVKDSASKIQRTFLFIALHRFSLLAMKSNFPKLSQDLQGCRQEILGDLILATAMSSKGNSAKLRFLLIKFIDDNSQNYAVMIKGISEAFHPRRLLNERKKFMKNSTIYLEKLQNSLAEFSDKIPAETVDQLIKELNLVRKQWPESLHPRFDRIYEKLQEKEHSLKFQPVPDPIHKDQLPVYGEDYKEAPRGKEESGKSEKDATEAPLLLPSHYYSMPAIPAWYSPLGAFSPMSFSCELPYGVSTPSPFPMCLSTFPASPFLPYSARAWEPPVSPSLTSLPIMSPGLPAWRQPLLSPFLPQSSRAYEPSISPLPESCEKNNSFFGHGSPTLFVRRPNPVTHSGSVQQTFTPPVTTPSSGAPSLIKNSSEEY